ncbi:helix-turn-helix domain-containing protein [Actinocrinis sp.]|uniref:helix-turn-helix domain-containing protein n=1 Tax=Actinocrinis sp. TaxID=1920516 RepID=UPI002D71D4EB|nr:helix-turn-helix domain-containing protein [Actinocrinis sp.]HZP52878.1 helix-turn-helix domain-containing protein [Actinocrinis sp.]
MTGTGTPTAEPLTAEPAAAEAPTAFGRLVRHHRTRIGLTQRELSDFSTISVRAIRDLEQGRAKRPRHDTVRLIADGLRLGPKAREALESAAWQDRVGWPLKADFDAEPPGAPAAPDALIGREPQIRALTAELSAGPERLTHIVGLTGVGKTRLALEVAARVHAEAGFPVLWSAPQDAPVEYTLSDAAENLAPVVRACVTGLFSPGAAEREGTAALVRLVGDQPALLVLDGAGDRAPRAEGVARLLRDCPRLRLLATSPAPFGLPRERVFLLEPLAVPQPSDEHDARALEQVPSAALLLGRIRRVRPGFVPEPGDLAAVARICRLLDGLPLALRAAASWLLVYDLATLHACLADGPGPLLRHLAGPDEDCPLPGALALAPLRLSAPVRDLLAALCERGGEFGLADVMALTGADVSDCGRMVRELLLLGATRTCHAGGQARFRVLNLVRAALAGPGATAARLPRELPQADSGRVSHGWRERV